MDSTIYSELLLEMVDWDTMVFRDITNPSEEVCLIAVWKWQDAIYWIVNPSEEVCLLAIKKWDRAIEGIIDPSILCIKLHNLLWCV